MPVAVLLPDNVTVTVEQERTGQDTSGGSSPTWTSLATGVSGIFTLDAGSRDGDFHSDAERSRAVFTSSSAYAGRSDVRFKLTATVDPALSGLINTYWRVENTAGHPRGFGGLRVARYTAKISQLVVPS